MSTDMKLSKARLFKTIQSGEFIGNMIDKLSKKTLMNFAILLDKDVLPKLATKANSYVLDKFERKISEKGAARAEKGFNLKASNEDINDIIRIIKSLESSSILIDCATEKVKHQRKNKKVELLLL